METLARFIVSAVDIAEAEGRMLRREVFRLAITLGLTIVSLLMAITGLGFLIFGIFQGLSIVIGTSWSAVILGTLWICMAAVVVQAIRVRL